MTLPLLKWRASPNFGSRGATRVDQIIIHDTEGGYSGSINWFAQHQSDVSAHFVVSEDGSEATQMVHLSDRAWHACAANSRSVGIEMAGFASKGYPPALLEAAAALAAELCHYLQIPVRHARGGVGPGLESHWGLGRAGGGHSDPSTDPAWMDSFIAAVQVEYDKGFNPHYFDLTDERPCALTPPPPAPPPVATAEPDAAMVRNAARIGTLNLHDAANLQRALNALGAQLAVDGAAGPATAAAVIDFQRAHPPLAVDGDAGPETRAAMLRALAS